MAAAPSLPKAARAESRSSAAAKATSRCARSAALTDSVGAIAQHKVTVTNTGSRDADHVVLGILKPPGAGQGGVPLQSLYDFARVHVRAGQSVTVALNASALDFTQVDETGQRAVLRGRYEFQFGIPETEPMGQGFAARAVVAK